MNMLYQGTKYADFIERRYSFRIHYSVNDLDTFFNSQISNTAIVVITSLEC